MFSGTAQVSHQVCQFFFVSSMCLLVRMTMVDKNKPVVCCLLTTSVIMLSEKEKRNRKMWSKGKGKGLPQQAEVAQGVPGRLRPRIFLTFGTTRVVGRQPYAPVTFTPG